MKDALLLVDVISRFDRDGGEALLESFRRRLSGFVLALQRARAAGVPVVYVNDSWGRWDSDAPGLLRSALEGRGADVLRAVGPQPEDRFVLKLRYAERIVGARIERAAEVDFAAELS